MNHFILDASAQVKRYLPEPGSPLVDWLVESVGAEQQHSLRINVVETFSIVVRARNRGLIDEAAFEEAVERLHWEALLGGIHHVPVPDNRILQAVPLVERHNINATDAVLLRVALDGDAEMRLEGDRLVLVASDDRLLRAAHREGLATFDPEQQDLATLQDLVQTP